VADPIPVIAGEVARRIGARLPDLTPEMTTMFIDFVPEFRHDQAVQRLMVASSASNLGAVVDMLMLGISREDIAVPPAAAEYARRFAQHDLSLEALLRAYRLGEHTLLQWVIEGLNDIYQTERQRWEETGLLIDPRDAVRVWVRRTLGELARKDESTARPRGDAAGVAGGERKLHRGRRADARAQEHRSVPGAQGGGTPGPYLRPTNKRVDQPAGPDV
jgi:hypothetical protein